MGETTGQRQTGYARRMTPFSQLHDLPRQLQRPAVRDLAWAVLSPPLLAGTPCPQRHPLAGSLWAQQPHRLEQWLRALDKDDHPLRDWLAKLGSRRLGLYYERLWQFALRHAPGIELLAANLAIREGGLTLGELDVLLRDADGVHHLELAIKLYLGPPSGGHDTQAWLGPGCHDRLGAKLAHLAQHQLPMSRGAHSQQALARLGAQQVQAHMWLGAICSIRGLGMPRNRKAPTRSTCAGAGSGGGIGPWRLASAGNRCRAAHGWRQRGSKRRNAGRQSSLQRGCMCWTRRPRRNCW